MPSSLSDDARWQAEQAHLESELSQIEAQTQAMEQQMIADAPMIRDEEAAPAKEWTPEETTRVWDEFGREWGLEDTSPSPATTGQSADHPDVLKTALAAASVALAQLGERAAKEVPAKAAEPTAIPSPAPPPSPKKSASWHYALNDETKGPVTEDELLELLGNGTLKLSSLVWNKTMTEWSEIAATPLADKIDIAPPPLPSPPTKKRAAHRAASARTACPACGRQVSTADRFCPGCGRPMNT